MKLILFLYFFSFSALAEFPYETAGDEYEDTQDTIHVIEPVSPVKSQDGIGLCYGFAATSLLEHYRCKEMNSNCQSSEDILSSLDVTSYYEHKRLIEGGHTHRILMNIQGSKRRIAREECIRFSALVHQMTDRHGRAQNSEEGGWNFLIQRWNEYKGLGKNKVRNDCVACLADAIKNTLGSVQTPKDQIQNAFYTASTLEDFLYKTIIPAQCLDDSQTVSIPPFNVKSFPGHRDPLNVESLTKKVENILLSSVPLEMGICMDILPNGSCHKEGGHSIVLSGIKEVCHKYRRGCKTMVKVKNSWGKNWQNENDGGWVDLKALAKSSLALGSYNNINWIEKPGFKLSNKTISKGALSTNNTQVIPANNGGGAMPGEYRNHKGMWRCPGNSFSDTYAAGCVPMK